MPQPKKKTSKSKRGMRRSHDYLKAPSSSKCSNCGEPVAPHRVCMHCGHYKGKEVLPVELED